MSSPSSVALARELPRYTWEEVKRLASAMKYQDYKDSPIIPYYTNWKELAKAETAPEARETLEPPLPPGLDPGRATVYLGAPGSERTASPAVPLARGDLEYWDMPVDGKLAAVHALRWHSGARIEASGRNYVILAGGPGYTGHHLELVVPDGAEASVVVYAHTPPQGVSTRSLRIRVGDDSRLKLTLIVADRGPQYMSVALESGNHSVVEEGILLIPGRMSHVKVDNLVKGDGARLHVRAATMARGRVRSDMITNALITGKEAESVVLHRGSVADGAFAVHRGSARITSMSEWASAEVESVFTLADEKSTAVSVPILEVDTGNVGNARHATVVAPPPPDVLFYLNQRGLTASEAAELMEMGVVETSGAPDSLGSPPEDVYLWVRSFQSSAL